MDETPLCCQEVGPFCFLILMVFISNAQSGFLRSYYRKCDINFNAVRFNATEGLVTFWGMQGVEFKKFISINNSHDLQAYYRREQKHPHCSVCDQY